MNRIRRILSALLLAALLTGALFAFSSSAGLFGDIDGDGGVTYEDAQLLFDYVAGAGRLTVSQLGAADINRDGSVTIADVAMLFHYVSGLFPSLPFEEGEYARLVVQTMPDKTEYIVGEDFDYGGLLVCAEYDGGKRVPLETYTLSALGTSTATGVKIVTVSAGGLQTAFTVTVLPDALTGIELTALPAKRTYVLGETLDLAGLRVNAVYASGTKAQISAYAVDGFDGSRAGVQTVTVFYRGFSKTFTVTVSASSAATVNTGSSALNVRSAPSLTASVVGTFAAGTRVEVLSREGEWTKVRGKTTAGTTLTGYCYTEYLLFD